MRRSLTQTYRHGLQACINSVLCCRRAQEQLHCHHHPQLQLAASPRRGQAWQSAWLQRRQLTARQPAALTDLCQLLARCGCMLTAVLWP